MKKRLCVLLLSFVMLFSMSMTAAAMCPSVPTIGTGTQAQEATACITKKLVLAEGITVPHATFRFEITAITEKAPAAKIADVTYPYTNMQTTYAAKPTNKKAVREIRQSVPIVFETFPHAGVFEYTVKEIGNTYTGEGTVSYSQDIYTLRVYVANKANGTVFVQNITAEKEGIKRPEIVFTNTYCRNSSLVIEKQTEGALADKTKPFDFTIKFTNAGTSDDISFTGSIGTLSLTCPVGQEVPFTLYDGQKLVFDKLPAGTRYVVTEKGVEDGYIPRVSVIENGTMLKEKQGTDKDDLTSAGKRAADNLVGEGKNEVTFINTFEDVPITGVTILNLPFILLIGCTLLALTALAVFSYRRASKHS